MPICASPISTRKILSSSSPSISFGSNTKDFPLGPSSTPIPQDNQGPGFLVKLLHMCPTCHQHLSKPEPSLPLKSYNLPEMVVPVSIGPSRGDLPP
ncbi:hypothetical protein TIFTF001_017258 [Ficus carica]|uniref:Uncharacterized protein n=1 Tax=Ficus carica TaxID=3494 RepID=A0AA88AA86_FICCA|nr:hypothetical protein TIFTF001_017258 [Ficus carica]